ncbi:MMPL family transporter [Actinomadura roseirufa]|uniref:MMPL family transporter n=1 Tax=Actinomadura roseirufa TaxID=2094049 RepID=UPI001040EFB6|nr:MMPL family transporter [Actinomadura roseirufa]
MLLESKPRGRPVTVRIAVWSARHPWRAIAGWFAFVVLCLVIGATVGGVQAGGADYRIGEAGRAEAMAEDGGLLRAPVEYVRVEAGPGADAAVADVTRRMRALPEVIGVAAPRRSADGKSLLVTVSMRGDEITAKDDVGALRAQTDAVRAAHPDVRVVEAGRRSVSKGVEKQRGKDLQLSEMLTLPVTLLVLLVAFGSILAAGVPVLLALSSIAAAMGLSMLVSHVLPDAGVGNNLILLIGMAVGVDYSLFYLKREREERARGELDAAAAVELAAATAGRAIVVSGLAVIVSTACLYLATDVIFSSLATGTIIVVAVAMVSSLTALPALLAKLDRRGRPYRERRERGGRMWAVLLRPSVRHPALTLGVATAALLALAAPGLGLKLGVEGIDSFSRKIPEVREYDRLTAAFPEELATHQVVVRAAPERSAQVGAALRDLARQAARPGTTAPEPRVSADRRVASLELAVPYRVSGERAKASLDRLRHEQVPATVGRVQGAEVAVTGDVARDVDYLAHQDSKLPWVIGFLLLVTYAMTVWAFRSVVMGLVGIALNLLSAAASFGLLVLVFQHTWAEGLLGFTSSGRIGARVPLFLFVILFGLAMDYQVFVVSRIREAVQAGVPTREAVVDGIGRSAGVVTSAAVVMMTVFATFVFLSLIEMKQIGFVLAAGVLLDAFVVRVLMLPALLTLLGERSWWPSRAHPAPVRGHSALATVSERSR